MYASRLSTAIKIGDTFGAWEVIGTTPGIRSGRNTTLWLCRCSCGTERGIPTGNLIGKKPSKSCGCKKSAFIRAAKVTHGESHGRSTPEYRAWANMHTRCYNRRAKSYKDYGARGITVCGRWRESYANFLADMGRKPHPRYTVDRLNENGNYEPGNCRWATKIQQGEHRRGLLMMEFRGEVKPQTEWWRILNPPIPYREFAGRIKRGMPVEAAIK